MHVLDHCLHAPPTPAGVPEQLPRDVPELVGQAEATGQHEVQQVIGELGGRVFACVGCDHVGRRRARHQCAVLHARIAGREVETFATIAVPVDVPVVRGIRVPRLEPNAELRVGRRRDLYDGGERCRALQPERASDGEGEALVGESEVDGVNLATFVVARRSG